MSWRLRLGWPFVFAAKLRVTAHTGSMAPTGANQLRGMEGRMCVIGYLVSKNEPGARTIGSAGVDSIGIKWSGEMARDKSSVKEILGFGREAEPEPREL